MTDPQHLLLRQYLLGDVDDTARGELDLKLLTDEDFAVSVDLAEEELIEEYLDGMLSPDEARNFQKYFLNAPHRRNQLDVTSRLREYSRNTAPETSQTTGIPFFEWITRLFTNNRALVYAAGFVIVVGIGIFFLWPAQDDHFRSLQTEYAALNQQDLRDAGVIGNAQVVAINPGTYRSGTQEPNIVVAGDSKAILFRLPLNFSVDPNTVYDASIDHDGRKVFTVDGARLYMEGGSLEARVLAPREVLSTGTHRITLIRRDSSNAPVVYTFEVR